MSTIKVTVTSVHMLHEGGTKEYLLDHILMTDTDQGGNNVVINHTVARWGGIRKKHSSKVEHDPGALRMDRTRQAKVRRGYQAPEGRTVIDYPSYERLKVAHPELCRLLTAKEIGPETVLPTAGQPAPEPDFYIPPTGSTSVTDNNPNLGIF